MKLSTLVATLTVVIASGCCMSPAMADSNRTIDKVLGSAVVGSQQHYGDISLVNGSIQMASDSSAKAISTVNGSIELRDNVQLDSASTVNGGISSGDNLHVNADVSIVNGKFLPGAKATIGGSIETVNGDIRLHDGKIGRDISTVNGDISLSGNTLVQGDIVFKPRGKKKSFLGWTNDKTPTLEIGANVTVQGNIVLQQDVTLKLENPALQDKVVRRD